MYTCIRTISQLRYIDSWNIQLGLLNYAVITLDTDKYGNGIHQWTVTASDLPIFFKRANVLQIVYGPLIFTTKLSILLLYRRVFAPLVKRKTLVFIQLAIWLNFSFYLALTLVKIFECTPRSKIWHRDAPGHCINVKLQMIATSTINMISDFSILFLPIFCIRRLQSSLRQNMISTAIAFALGTIACVCSIMSLEVSIRNETTSDWTHDWFPGFLWTSAEVTSGIIASCVPSVSILSQRLTHGAQDPVANCGNRSPCDAMERTIDTTPPLGFSPPQKIIEATPERNWELGDLERGGSSDHPCIFQGNSYTMSEARAEEMSAERRRELDHGGNQEGILRIVEVDVKSGPG
ncbi:hypothetical protein BDW42DRAFT_71054 [Aspergillus taichungensis]|uniref:Rhodopsin domain-containing protein n=1 Tax=Aspergillus taichungensis TaxID=482145 RepID=A0A2J5HZY1_9EURO|nr:hypothetical protein BDW42DRAFT_71054 [Aspergillus taichungensis]